MERIVMRFDLLDAMEIMKENFGNDGEIEIQQNDVCVFVRLKLFKDKELYNYQFAISRQEIRDSMAPVFNFRFKRGIEELKSISA